MRRTVDTHIALQHGDLSVTVIDRVNLRQADQEYGSGHTEGSQNAARSPARVFPRHEDVSYLPARDPRRVHRHHGVAFRRRLAAAAAIGQKQTVKDSDPMVRSLFERNADNKDSGLRGDC